MRKTDVVTAFLVRRSDSGMRVLILRRSDRVGSYRGRWAAVSGYLEADTPLEQALIEIEEEAGLSRDHITLLASAEPLDIPDPEIGVHWRVHPFLFEVSDPDLIRTDWEHTESRWVEPDELRKTDTVPGLADALEALLDRAHADIPAGHSTEGK